jgi:hypothetical protein
MRRLSAAPGIYTLTGGAAQLLADRIIQPGAYLLSGEAVALLYSEAPEITYIVRLDDGELVRTVSMEDDIDAG